MTDLTQPATPQPADPLPEAGGDLPKRGGALPHRGGALPHRGEALPERGEPLPQRREPLSGRPDQLRGEPLPQRRPSHESGTDDGSGLAQRGVALPRRGEPLPQRGEPLPQRGEPLPQRGGPLPQRGEPANGAEPLPRRTTRTRPAGRHRSPHRLSVASDAPALVLAVPGTAEADSAGLGAAVAAIAELSCPGVDIRVGYLEGDALAVSECLRDDAEQSGQDQFPSVIVPLLLSPSPKVDAVLDRLAAQPAIPALLAGPLGPHPLVAEALHSRLAEAGLARHARSSGLSISADGRGVIVLADVGEEATSAAAVAAVLLASRLSVPVVPASLGDPASIADAVTRLSDSGAPRPALAPCLIGPEVSLAVLNDLAAALGAPCALPLGAHQAVGQLVAIRYGAALARLSVAAG